MTDVLPDLTNCDREPITRLERIQAFGFLIALTNEWIVVRASSNLENFVRVGAHDAIGQSVSSLFQEDALHEIRNRLAMLHPATGSERLYDVKLLGDGRLFDVAIHYAGDLLVIEGELSGPETQMNAASLVRSMVGRLSSQTTMDAFHRDAARQVRAISGFDRVMIYRFDAEGVGEVIAESLKGGIIPLLGLHYPASDIPVQARALYLRNAFRIIPDVTAAPVDLYPPVTAGEPLDLTLAYTRAVSPVHIEYLRNMGVAASMSISIVVAGRLWGLISCHHETPRLPGFVLRSGIELFGQMYSLTLENRLREATSVIDQTARDLADRMITTIAGDSSKLSDAQWLQDVTSEIIESDGVAVSSDGRVTSNGATPTHDELPKLTRFLDTLSPGRIFHTDHLGVIVPTADPFTAAGLLAIPISRKPRDYILLFRRERLHQINWGGDPVKTMVMDDDGVRMSPRKSFAAFAELVKGRSLPFSDGEVRVAESIRSALIEVILRFSEQAGSDRKRTGERQELLIAELNHRVRNILALIRGLINQTQSEGVDTAEYVQSLGGRVQALARAHDQITRRNWGPALLHLLFDDEVAAYVPNKRERFIVRGPAIALKPQAYSTMALVVHELVTNSSKYGALSDGGDVTVDLERTGEGDLRILWRESGGPVVTPPTRRGFGSVIIERTLPFDLQGKAEVRYPETGLEADFLIPAAHLAATDKFSDTVVEVPAVAFAHGGADTLLAGRTVLLLEDNMIVALEAEDTLLDLGAQAVWVASTLREAEAIIVRERIDLAMLDINIGLDTSLDLAARLAERGIPFIFASGYGDDVRLAEGQAAVPILKKPYDGEQIRRAMTTALAAARAES